MSSVIENLTQHPASAEQIEQGVQDLSPADRAELMRDLTFEELPMTEDVRYRAKMVANKFDERRKITGTNRVMLGGAPFFMSALEHELGKLPDAPEILYSFSKRGSVETPMPDGSVQKTSVFRHAGFVSLPKKDEK